MDENDFENKFIGNSVIGFIIAALTLGGIFIFFKYIFFTPFFSVKYIGDITVFKIFILFILLILIGGFFASFFSKSKDKKKKKYNKKRNKRKK